MDTLTPSDPVLASRAARYLASLRKVHTVRCQTCGRLFQAVQQAKTCSGYCRLKRHRDRRAALAKQAKQSNQPVA